MTESKHPDWSVRVARSCDILLLQGTSGFERRIDHSIELAKYLAGKIKEREGFELVVEVRVFLRREISLNLEALLTHCLWYRKVRRARRLFQKLLRP